MRLLLDTHAFLWFISNDPSLSSSAKASLEDENNDVFLSLASVWEMAIKVSLGKLSLPTPFEEFITEQLRINAIDRLPITVVHASAVVGLPFHHRDPFDRLLVVQAQTEGLTLVSRDTALDAYGIGRLW